MNKYAIVNLKGGLANQLFQISFTNYLKSNGFITYVIQVFMIMIICFQENWS